MLRLLTIVFILLITPLVHGEMYRWVDQDGKVHFSDKKPGQYNSEEISDSVKNQNTDSGGRNTKQQLKLYERNQAAKNTEKKQQMKQANRGQQKLEENCLEAKKRLRIIRGRVVFYDDNGKEMKVSEKERQQRTVDLEQQIVKYCR